MIRRFGTIERKATDAWEYGGFPVHFQQIP